MQTLNKNDVLAALQAAYRKYAHCREGKNASYIPALAKASPDRFALAAVTVQGDELSIGEADEPFPIESISKAFNLALAMDLFGPRELRAKIGAEATGEPFNSVMALELHHGKPLTPLVNAGAISAVSLIPGENAEVVWEKISERMALFAGENLPVNEEVYRSETATNHHNKGLAWLMKSYGYLYSDPDVAVDLYTRMCSLNVTTMQLARMGVCYANGGLNPLTGKCAVKKSCVPEILADMMMEGLYTEAGDWLYANGLPAKSGVGGGIVCIVPGKMALAAFSPPLDSVGNSVRAMKALTHIVRELRLNPLAVE